jgi:REP element-mobilizing transposase RayT
MARKSRKVSGTGIYHVMLRGTNRQDIFEDSEDYLRFLTILRNIVYPIDDFGKHLPSRCNIYAYCLMTNHVHLLIRESAEALASVIHRIATAYAHYYNNKYFRCGHLFQDRFKSEPVNDQGYFFTLLRYIHQNPMAAGLSKGIDDYEWSSWKEYAGYRGCTSGFCDIRAVLSQMPIHELHELVSDPLPKAAMILDLDSGRKILSDEDVKVFLSSFGLRQPADLQLYSRERRREILREAKLYGASIRQLVRLTGISFYIVKEA